MKEHHPVFEREGIEFPYFAEGKVVATLINRRMEKHARKAFKPPAIEVDRIAVSAAFGVHGDHHGGTRDGGIRELKTCGIPRGTRVLNWREFSAVSVEELAAMAHLLDLEEIPHGALGENLVIAGIPGLTQLPPTSLLHFFAPDGSKRAPVLAVWGENRPCAHPGAVLQRHFFPEREDLPKAFADLALLPQGLRGIVGQVFATGKGRSGTIHRGDTVRVQRFLPR